MKPNRVPKVRYRPLDHTADIRFRIYGKNQRELFQNAVWALTDTLTDAARVRPVRRKVIRIQAKDPEQLLVHLLKEVLHLFEARRFLVSRLAVRSLEDKMLEAAVWGESLKRHPLKTEIKGVTYHGLKVEKKLGRWTAEVVLDV